MNTIDTNSIVELLRREANSLREQHAIGDQQWAVGGRITQADVDDDRDHHNHLLAAADWLARHDPARYTRLALRTSHLLGLFRDHALSFDHHDDAMLDIGCRLIDDIESILNDINGYGTPPASHVERLERFAQSFLTIDAAYSTTAAQRDAARHALGMPPAEQYGLTQAAA